MWEGAHPPKCRSFESRFEKSKRLSSMCENMYENMNNHKKDGTQ
jgi:hypothetical protein